MKVYLINSDPYSGPSAIYLTREETDKHAETFAHCLVDEHTIDTLPPEAHQGLHLYLMFFTYDANKMNLRHSHTFPEGENAEARLEETTTKTMLPNRTFVVRLWALNKEDAIEQATADIKEKFSL